MKRLLLVWFLATISLAPRMAVAAACKAVTELGATNDECDASAGVELGDAVVLQSAPAAPVVEEAGKTILKPNGPLEVHVYSKAKNAFLSLILADKKIAKIETPNPCKSYRDEWKSLEGKELFCWLSTEQGFELDKKKYKATQAGTDVDAISITTWTGNEPKPVIIAGVQLIRTATDVKGTVALVRIEPSNAGGNGAAANQPAACTDGAFDLPGPDALWKRCKEMNYLCLAPSGQVIHQPVLDEGRSVTVALVQPESREFEFELEVEFERTRLLQLKEFDDTEDSAKWFVGVQHAVFLASAGRLHVTTRIRPKTAAAQFAENQKICVVNTAIEKKHVFEVSGHYHFMLGIMPAFAGLFDRRHTLNRSDDGVQRLYQQDIRDVDWVFTLSGYPWGASFDKFGAVGLLVGTSVRDIGTRWYAGLELDSPIGLGLVGGAAVVVVPELDDDFVSGQPLTDTQAPVHNTGVVTWFVGINIEAHLFAKAFKGLAGDDKD